MRRVVAPDGAAARDMMGELGIKWPVNQVKRSVYSSVAGTAVAKVHLFNARRPRRDVDEPGGKRGSGPPNLEKRRA